MYKVGTSVRQIVKPIEGRVKRLVAVNDGQDLEYLVEYEDAERNTTERHFKDGEIEEIPATESKEPK